MAVPIANPKAQVVALRKEIDEALALVFDKCNFILGDNVKALEDELPAFCDAKYGISVNSGTDALYIALAACGITKDDEVITTPFTFVATNEAIMILGAKPVYVDIEPNSFNIDVSQIEAAITPKTKAIMPIHLYGQCCDIEAIEKIANKHNLKLVADGAQAVGSKHKGKGIGAYGDASTLSFYPTKNLGGCGDGGMILTNNPEIDKSARSFRFHGMSDTYTYAKIGFCSRLDEIQAAILRVKMKYIAQWNEKRRTNAVYYIDRFKELPIKLPIAQPDNYHIYHQFAIRFNRRDELKEKLTDAGVGSAVFYPSPLHIQEAYAKLGYKQGDFVESEKACKEVLCLPIFPELSDEDRQTVADTVIKAVKELA